MKKCYLFLITCTSTRTVHLEVTTDVNANSLSLALRRFIARRGISPCYGGLYEQLIAIVKNSLKKILGRARLTYDEIHTFICKIENIVIYFNVFKWRKFWWTVNSISSNT